jgi:hypothetical protein
VTLDAGKPPPRPNRAVRRTLRGVLLLLLLWFLVWLVIGSVIRLRMERPVRFIGGTGARGLGSAVAALPLHLGETRAAVLDPRHHKQEV